MAIKLKLKAYERVANGKGGARKLRAQGLTPAIIYGSRKDTLPVSFNTNEFLKIVHGEAHENMIFEVNLEGDNVDRPNVIIKQMQFDPVKGTLLHVDFFEILMDQKIEVHVPLLIKGDAVGVKDEGGLLDHLARNVLIECLPKDLPEIIEIDVSNLKLGESVHINDISFPPGVKPVENPDKVLLTVIHKFKGKIEAEGEIVAEEKEPEVLTQKAPKSPVNE